MPELPEVETLRKYLEQTSLHQKITAFTAEDPKRQLTKPLDEFREMSLGRQMVQTTRIGKHLLVKLDNDLVLSLHFGMTGDLHFYRIPEDAPRFERAVFYFDSGFKLAFVDSRKFGRLGLWESETVYREAKKLGPDALDIPAETLKANLEKRNVAIKTALLDQKVLAGIGNWLVDEILFQARINPEKTAATLSEKEFEQLHKANQAVLRTSVEKEAIYRELPPTYLIHAREWDESPHIGKDQHKFCPNCRTGIIKTVVGGRATYFCPQCQVL